MNIQVFICILMSILIISCQSKPVRIPSSEISPFDPQKVSLLKWAAKNKILFQIDDSSFQHISVSSLDSTCEKRSAPAWSELVFQSLDTLKKSSRTKVNIHILDIKMGAEPSVSITQDLDGLTYLNLKYIEKTNTRSVTSLEDIPCDKKDPSLIGQVRTDKFYEYPTQKQILNALSPLKPISNPDRWKFKSDFLTLLAENMTLFRLTPDVSFEKSFDGKPLLAHFLNQQAEKISSDKNTEALHYWLSEITKRSHSGSYLNMFTLKSDKNLTTGITTHENSFGVAYPFMSYKIEAGQFLISEFSKLEKCLSELKLRYRRSLASMGNELSTQSESFLYPGFTCQESN